MMAKTHNEQHHTTAKDTYGTRTSMRPHSFISFIFGQLIENSKVITNTDIIKAKIKHIDSSKTAWLGTLHKRRRTHRLALCCVMAPTVGTDLRAGKLHVGKGQSAFMIAITQ